MINPYPTEHSTSRFVLAQSMLPFLLKANNIIAIVVGGSVGRGCADEYSDLEIGLVWQQKPTSSEQQNLLKTLGTPNLDDSIFIGGTTMETAFKVDVIHTTVDEIHKALNQEEKFEELRGFLWASIPIHNLATVKTWQETLQTQFEDNRPNLIQNQIHQLTQSWHEFSTLSADEYMLYRSKQIDIIATLIRIICFTQHKVAHSKWIHWSINQTDPCFHHLPQKLLSLFGHEPNTSFAMLREICLESLKMIKCETDLTDIQEIIKSTPLEPSVTSQAKIERCNTKTANVLLTKQLDMPWFALNRAIFYAKRQEPCIFWRMMDEYADFVLRTLCLTNNIQPPPEDTPCSIHLLPQFKKAPKNFTHRLKKTFMTPLSGALETMHHLIEDTFNVVETSMPNIMCAQSRHSFHHDRRPFWPTVPTLLK